MKISGEGFCNEERREWTEEEATIWGRTFRAVILRPSQA
jgi:hypothetical protein